MQQKSRKGRGKNKPSILTSKSFPPLFLLRESLGDRADVLQPTFLFLLLLLLSWDNYRRSYLLPSSRCSGEEGGKSECVLCRGRERREVPPPQKKKRNGLTQKRRKKEFSVKKKLGSICYRSSRSNSPFSSSSAANPIFFQETTADKTDLISPHQKKKDSLTLRQLEWCRICCELGKGWGWAGRDLICL